MKDKKKRQTFLDMLVIDADRGYLEWGFRYFYKLSIVCFAIAIISIVTCIYLILG